jgi:hypothetical protein
MTLWQRGRAQKRASPSLSHDDEDTSISGGQRSMIRTWIHSALIDNEDLVEQIYQETVHDL